MNLEASCYVGLHAVIRLESQVLEGNMHSFFGSKKYFRLARLRVEIEHALLDIRVDVVEEFEVAPLARVCDGPAAERTKSKLVPVHI